MERLMRFLGITKSSLLRSLALFYAPWFVLATRGFFCIPEPLNYVKELLGFGLFTSCFFALVLIPNSTKFRQWMAIFSAVLLTFLCFSKLSFYIHYGTKLSVSALFVIFETNQTEAADFLANYFSWQVVVLALVFIIIAVLTIRFFTQEKPPQNIIGKPLWARAVFLLAIFGVCFYGVHWKFQEENIPLTVVSSWGEYTLAKKQLKDQLATPLGVDKQVSNLQEGPETVVVIIGESTSRRNMSLYGYHRPTNPLLAKRSTDLVIFDSVISPHVHTITAVDKILTLNSFKKNYQSNNVSVVQLANQAGFETYWISGQRPVGIHESVPTIIGNAARHKKFINTDDYKDIFYDQALLEYVQEAIADTPQQKVIFVHLMGTHVGYNKRYPKEFEYFKNGEARKQQQINQYDNAVRYNDSIVNEVITMLSLSNSPAKLVYFSDHGDDVYLEQQAIGHNEYRPTRPMYQVPLFIWSTNKIYAQHQQKRYSLEDFPHTFAQLCGFSFNGLQQDRSILSTNFTEQTRIIKDSIDYDSNW